MNQQVEMLKVTAVTDQVIIRVDDKILATTNNAIKVSEYGQPAVYYIPSADLSDAQLQLSGKQTLCPFKGIMSYWNYPDHEDIAWSFMNPISSLTTIKAMIGFTTNKVDIIINPVS